VRAKVSNSGIALVKLTLSSLSINRRWRCVSNDWWSKQCRSYYLFISYCFL